LTGDIMITSIEMSTGDGGQFDKERLLYKNQGNKKKLINSMNDSVLDNIFGLVLSVDQFVVADVGEGSSCNQRQNRLMIYRE
jgi:hypothetical protein